MKGFLMRMKNMLSLAAMALVMSGCASRTYLMPTPVVVAEGLVDPFDKVVPERRNSEAPVFVVSGRTVSGRTEPGRFYSNDRSRELRLGLATVEIGPGMSWEELVRESRAENRKKKPETVLAAYEEFGPLWSTTWPPTFRFDRDWDAPDVDREPAERFVAAIEAVLASSRRRQLVVFVHGFNTYFDENLKKCGEFWHYMGRDAVAISFDWPSKGSLFSYEVDKANADFAVRQFRLLLEFLAENTSASQINILAHSAGCPVAVEAARQLSLEYYDLEDDEAHRRAKIGLVVLAAPDMDLDSCLSAGVDGAGRLTQGWIVYASRQDKALGFAAGIFGDVRVGRSIGKLPEDAVEALVRNDTQWIDVTAAQKLYPSFIGHSYYYDNPWISSDAMLFLALGATAEQRGLVRDMETGFLVFPDDYEQNLPQTVEHLRAEHGTGSSE